MKRLFERTFKILFIVIVIAAMAAPQAVFAQDAVPTDAPAASTEVVSTEAPTEAPVVEETAAPTEAATEAATEAVTEEAAATETVVETAAPTEVPVVEEDLTEVVDALDAADITIVDSNGDPLAMGSEEAAEVISNSDPFFWDGAQWVGYTSLSGTCPSFVAVCNQVALPFTEALSVVPADTTLYVEGGSTYETATNYAESVEIATSGLSFVGFSALAAGAGSSSTIDPSLIIPGYAILQQILLKADFGTTLGVYADKVIVWNDLDGVGPLQDGFLNDALELINIGNKEATIEADLTIYEVPGPDGYYRVADANDPTTNFEWESGDSEESLPEGTYHMIMMNPYSEEIIDFYSHEGPDDGSTDIHDLMIGATMSEQTTLDFMEPEDKCPAGTTKVGSVCQSNPTECPAGSYLHDGQCRSNPTCPAGMSWDGSTCQMHRPPSGCPAGTWEFWGHCYAPPNVCPTGTVLSGGHCVAPAACPVGTIPNGSKCETPTIPTCPDGTVMNSETGMCDLPAWMNHEEKHAFWEILGKTSGETELTDPIYDYVQNPLLGGSLALNQVVWFLKPVGLLTPEAGYPGCEKDEVLIEGNCVKTKNACDSGWTYSTEDNKCHKNTSPVCESGYVYNSDLDKCVKSNNPGCPDDYDYSPALNQCVKTRDPYYGTTTCHTGYTYNPVNHKCEKKADPTCSSGYTFNPDTDKCEKKASPTCDYGYTYNPTTDKCEKSVVVTCSSGYRLNTVTGKCEKIIGLPDCPYGTVLSTTSGKCEKPVTMCGDTSYKTLGFTEGCGSGDHDKCKPLSFLKYPCPAGQYLFDGKCETPCSYDISMPASSAKCVPCVFNPKLAATDPACPAPCTYNASIPSTDPACVPPPPPPIPVTGATPALAIPVTGGALIPVTGGTLIVSGLGHSCMTYNNGQVICWGLNASGQLGDGSTVNKSEPVYAKDLNGVLNLTAGSKHTCALTISGEVWCWGENSSGQLGNGSTTNSNVPVKVAGLPDKVLSITAGDEFTCVQLMNQEVWCWGKNDLGQLNDGTTTNQTSPVKSKLTAMLAQISGGQGLLLGSDVLGSVNEWVKAQAAAVKQLANSLSISANRWGDTGCAVATDGSVKCWGSDLTSASVAGALPAIEVGTGLDHNCSINSDESVSCWGSNGSGQLGNGTNTDSESATLVKNLALAHALAVGAHHTCVLSGAGNTAMCWGENTFGQLGNSSTVNSNVPVLVVMPK